MKKVNNIIIAACRKLELTVLDMDITLSVDPVSVASLEDIILSLKQMGDKSALSGACFMVGSYLGEIIRQKLGGDWIEEGNTDSPAMRIGDKTIFPIEKVKKFAQNPDGESLIFYVDTLTALS
jgi:hypothetical protein